MRRIALAAFALTVLPACQAATYTVTEQWKAEIAAEVDVLHAQLWDALQTADFDRVMSYLHNSQETAWGYEGLAIFGWDAMYETFAPAFAAIEGQNANITESRTTEVSADIAYVIDKGSLSVTDSAGVTGPGLPFTLTVLWVRHDGGWKVQFGHESLAPPENT